MRWDFGGTVGRLISLSHTYSQLDEKPELSDWTLWAPSHEVHDKRTGADSKIVDESEVLDLTFHEAAETLGHLSEQELQDMSEDYFVDPQLKKLVELGLGIHSRKGKDKARPRYQYAANLTFMTVDGVSEFLYAKQLPIPRPVTFGRISRAEYLNHVNDIAFGQMSKEEYLKCVNKITKKVDPAAQPLRRPIGLITSRRLGIPRRTLDVSQPATMLKRFQAAKAK